jgi:WD40 repeat protein
MGDTLVTRLGITVAIHALWLVGPVAQGQERVQLVPQSGMTIVTSVAFSPDGQSVLTASIDNAARLWDAKTGQQLRFFVGHSMPVSALVFSPDGRFVLTGSFDGTARLWDLASGQQLRSFEGHTDRVKSVAFSADGRFVLTGSFDGTARLWDAATGQHLRSFEGHTATVLSVAFSPNGRRVLTGSDDKTVRVWDAATAHQLSFSESKDAVTSVAFSPDGRFFLTVVGDSDGKAWLWDAATGERLRSIGGRPDDISSVAFSPDGLQVLTGSSDGKAQLWDAATGQSRLSFEGDTEEVNSVAYSPDGRFVLAGSFDGTARLWDAATGKQIRSFQGYSSPVFSAVFSLDGHLVLTGGWDQAAELWDAATGRRIRSFGGGTNLAQGLAGKPTSVALSPDGRYLLTGGDSADLHDAATGKLLRSFDENADHEMVSSVAFSPKGHFVLTGSSDQTARLWNATTGRLLRSFKGHTDAVNSVVFSRDGGFVLTGSSDKTARLWNAATGKQIRSFEGHTEAIGSVALSPDGRFVLTGSTDKTARLWDAATGQQLRSFEGHTAAVLSVAFSPNGHQVLTGTFDGPARLWDSTTGQQLRSFEGHTGWVMSVAFSPDGRFVLTGSGDATTRLWDAASGKELAALVSFEKRRWAVVAPDGRFDTNDLDGGAPLIWVASSEPMRGLPLEIFMRDYYTPRLLSIVMNREKLPPIRSIAEIKNRVQPEVAIVSVSASKQYRGRADVVVHAASLTDEKGQASGLQDLRLFRNGQMVGYLEGSLKDGDLTFSAIQLSTSSKTATFTTYAFNSERIKSATAWKEYEYEPGAPAKPRAWLLQIGVNHYQASGCELHASASDADKLSRILTQKLAARGLDVIPVKLTSTNTEGGATKVLIRKALEAVAAVARPDDVFFFSFSGHGFGATDGQFYIFPSDIEGSCTSVDDKLLAKAISAVELTQWLRPIDAGEMTFILDSCDSASSVESNGFKPGPMGSRGLGQLAYDKRMRILAASQPNQAARESDALHQGLLTYALTQEGLVEGKADWKPVDRKITVGEWLSYAADAVPKYLEAGRVNAARGVMIVGDPTQSVKSVQIPVVFDFSGKDTFVLQ